MKSIFFHDTLVYYDGIEVFEARDRIGGNYVGVLTDREGDLDQYLVAGVIPENLGAFRAGHLDLRSLMLDSADDEWYFAWTNGDFREPITLVPATGSLHDFEHVLGEGFILYEAPRDDQPLLRARADGILVLELRATPPETWDRHRIRMNTLGGLLLQVQVLLRYAYSSALRELSSRTRRNLDTNEGHLMDVVVPAAPGSFQIVLEAVRRPDMLGFSELERALERLDEVFESASDPETARQGLQGYKGHLAGSYIRLIKFLADNNMGLRYGWASPKSVATKYSGISESVARVLADTLADATNLGREEVEIRGAFERVNYGAGTWGLNTDDGMKVGLVAEGSPDLSGLTVSESYIFECDEVIDLDATGRESRTLYLRRIEVVG